MPVIAARRTVAATLIALGVLASPAHAQSGDEPSSSSEGEAPSSAEKEACASAFERGQELELSGRLQAARASFVRCAANTCPAVLGAPCVKAVQRLDADIPSIVIAATGGAGEELRDVRVLVDGELRAETLNGTAIAVDPGTHRVRAERRGSPPIERDILIRVGERNRSLQVSFAEPRSSGPKPTSDATAPRSRVPAITVLVAGGVGVSIGAVAGALALANKGELDGVCPTSATCDPSREGQIAAMKTQSLVSTVGFAAGAAGLAVGAVLFVIASRAPNASKASVAVGPGSIELRGTF